MAGATTEHLVFTPPSEAEETSFHDKLQNSIKANKEMVSEMEEPDEIFVIEDMMPPEFMMDPLGPPQGFEIDLGTGEMKSSGDFIEEKINADGSTIRKEVHNGPNGI